MPRELIALIGQNRISCELQGAGEILGIVSKTDLQERVLTPIPQEDDYIFVDFRAISKAYLGARGYHIDLSSGDVLKESVELLKGVTVYPDHYKSVNNWVGAVVDARWEEQSATRPAGINDTMKIDAVAHPLIARGLQMNPPAIHSSSVSFDLEWTKSHPNMDGYQFWANLGKEIDGQLVRIIVTKVRGYWEHSLVHNGGDRDARKLNQEAETERFRQQMLSSYDKKSTAFISMTTMEETMEKTVEGQAEELKQSVIFRTELLKQLGIEEESPSIDRVESAVLSLIEKNAALVKDAAMGQEYLKSTRAEALRLASITESVNGKLNEGLANTISNASLQDALNLKSHYAEKVKTLFPMKCQDCGSTNVECRSSIETKPKSPEAEAKKENSDLSGFVIQ